MKKNIYSILVILSVIILIINIFVKSDVLTGSIIFSCNLFIRNVFPSLFPMFVLSFLLIEIGIPNYLGYIFDRLFWTLFKCNGTSSFVFFISLLTGFPSSAKTINDLIDKRMISNSEANKVLLFTFFSNPLFIVNTVGNSFFNSKSLGVFILLSIVIGNIITGIIFKNWNRVKYNKQIVFDTKMLINRTGSTDLFNVFISGIEKALEVMINIFGIITMFILIFNLFFGAPSSYFKILISGILEMTTGLKYLSLSNYSLYLKLITTTFFLSFGGLSIHAQIISILKEKKVKYLPFLSARIIQSIISIVLITIFFYVKWIYSHKSIIILFS